MPQPTARERFFLLLRTSLAESSFTKLTLGKHRGRDATLNNLFIRPVVLKTGPQLTFVYRHATNDITKNLPYAEAIALGVVGMLIVADVINTFDDEIHDGVEELHDADVRLGNWFD